jgi:hypothetical protein
MPPWERLGQMLAVQSSRTGSALCEPPGRWRATGVALVLQQSGHAGEAREVHLGSMQACNAVCFTCRLPCFPAG